MSNTRFGELVFFCLICDIPAKQFNPTLYTRHFKMKIILEETSDLFDLILMTPEGLWGGRVAHNGSPHCFFFSFFCCQKSQRFIWCFRWNFLWKRGCPLGGDVICLAYIQIVQAGRGETICKHQVIDIMVTSAVLFVLWCYLWLKEQMLKLNGVFF